MSKLPFAVGLGYDVHRLKEGIPLRLCGVTIPFHKGLDAHSDGDVALHALCDALLGALALGDIGKHFPPNDDTYKNINSCQLLQQVVLMIREKGYAVGNVDLTILAEKPKIMKHIPAMQEALQPILGVGVPISIKATTNEQLGFVGREEGIAAHAVALVYRVDDKQ